MNKYLTILSLILLTFLLSGWGTKGHRKISESSASAYPQQIGFLRPTWSDYVWEHASDADYRKSSDPDESPRHYIDIDSYPLFNESGKIPMSWDSAVTLYGFSFVIGEGILPWATVRAYDSLESCFSRKDWNGAAQWAADLGHYIGDGHMPLHITRNYNGQYTQQTGIHSRYETKLIGLFEDSVIFDPGTAAYISNVSSYIFTYIYANHNYADSVLLADDYAYLLTGSHSSDAYYDALWEKTGRFTTELMKHGSWSLASLIYTAWVEAGSPAMDPNGVDDKGRIFSSLSCWPNPFPGESGFSFEMQDGAEVTAELLNTSGKVAVRVYQGFLAPGRHQLKIPGATLPQGMYLLRISSGEGSSVIKVIKAN